MMNINLLAEGAAKFALVGDSDDIGKTIEKFLGSRDAVAEKVAQIHPEFTQFAATINDFSNDDFTQKMQVQYDYMVDTFLSDSRFNNEIYFLLFFASQHCLLFKAISLTDPEPETVLLIIQRIESLQDEIEGLHGLRLLMYILWMTDYKDFKNIVRQKAEELLQSGFLEEKPSVYRKDFLDEESYATAANLLMVIIDDEESSSLVSSEYNITPLNLAPIFAQENGELTAEAIDDLIHILELSETVTLIDDFNKTKPETKTWLNRLNHCKGQLITAKEALAQS